MGGCCFDNEVEKAILAAGDWEIMELERDGSEGDHLMLGGAW